MKTDPGAGTKPQLSFSLAVAVKAVLVGLIFYLALALLTTIVINFLEDLEIRLPMLAYIAQYLTSLITGLVAGWLAEQSGWLHGFGAGTLFMVAISLLGGFILPAAPALSNILWWRLFPGAFLGLVGGTIGANL